MQNGVLMHTLDVETQLKPRRYDGHPRASAPRPEAKGQAASGDMNSNGQQSPEHEGSSVYGDPSDSSISDDEITALQRQYTLPVNPVQKPTALNYEKNWATDTDLQQANREELPNFNSLSYNGTSMTDATIGGFRLNIPVAQSKALEFVPLPPVCLPMIFIDKDLNFFHHFFQGMDVLLGKEYMEKVLSQGKYSKGDSQKILPSLKTLILAGAKPEDTELTMFVKRVLSGTFNTLPPAAVSTDLDELIVAVNMWGFQYLEPSMRCRDNELRMWLSMSFMKYQVSWFNSFKSSGVPKFALYGVQDRYESRGDSRLRLTNIEREQKTEARVFRETDNHVRRHRQHRRPATTNLAEVEDSSKKGSVLGRLFN